MIKIGNKLVGYAQPCFVVAEIGINHNGDINIAKQLIDVAANAGCNAVKFQKRCPDLCVPEEQKYIKRETPWGLLTYLEYRYKIELTFEDYEQIDAYCKKKKILWFASPWDIPSVDFLEQFDVPCYKIASACNQDKELLGHIKSKGRPIIVSTGMTDDTMLGKIVSFLCEDALVIMHSVSTYPAKNTELNLSNIPRLIKEYPGAIIGYSGHEVGAYASLLAALLGACVVERHITIDRSMWGTDQAASLETGGLMKLMWEIRQIPIYLGNNYKVVLDTEKPVEVRLRRHRTL